MRYRLAAFDFDGTLADSFDYFVGNVNSLARRHGFREIDPARVAEYRELEPRELMKMHGLPAWKLPFVARDFLALMASDAAQVRPFAGIVDELRALAGRGVMLAIVTSNSADNVRRILGEDLFHEVRFTECGASMFGKRRRLERVMRAAGASPRDSIYVGDQSVDGEAARDAGMAFGAVHWGYASPHCLDRYAPALRFGRVDELRLIAARD